MYFVKTDVSLFALSSFAAAQYAEDEHAGLSPRQLAEIAQEEYLAARDEYIEKRDIFRRAPRLMGTCQYFPKTKGKVCVRNGHGCGICTPNMAIGAPCPCGH
ncbi:unnamed protein product [Clonostachys rhizophaga]|uniref:Uncharacterized protein n=1 Tax=Clonostachys rhizophaga TaxID=160324 RepID=A0A9N9VYM6_9HYPO|nr:unnamed protein product [Clonostachys rhizophaga]